jgi:hypothetical protein
LAELVSGRKIPGTRKSQRYAKASVVFAALFVLSACALLASLALSQGSSERPPGSLWPANASDREIDALGIISLLASVASLIGFASSTYLKWRTDKRETREAALEWQRKELEIEKLRLELGKMKAQNGTQ